MSDMKVAIQMDPLQGIHIEGDSTFRLALEAQARGCHLYHYLPDDLVFRENRVMAHCRPLTVRDTVGDHFDLGEWVPLDLAEDVDVILMRQDPPFDMTYITLTHLLELICDRTLVVNDPAEVRNAPEKLFVTRFASLMPPTMIARRREDILDFRADYGDIIIKPLYGNGGAGVFRLPSGDENLNALLEMFGSLSREPVMVQQYLPDVRQGDKRIILVDGKAVGAVNRIPAAGEARSNLHVGGLAEKAELTARDREICDAIGDELYKRGLVFVGIDVIGGWLTEINVTSPTGIREIERFDGVNIARLIWDAIEHRLQSRQG